MVAVVNWFSRHRSKAVALSQLGFSIGGLCVPLVVLALDSFGWRHTAFASGVFVLVVDCNEAVAVASTGKPSGNQDLDADSNKA